LKAKLFLLKIVLLLFFKCPLVYAQQTSPQTVIFDTQKVVPNSYTSITGTNPFVGPFSNTQMTYQLLIAASQLTDLVNKNLVSISFRNTFNSSTPWPNTETTFINYDIYLGQAVNPVDRTLSFSQNAVGLITLVRSGNLVVPINALTIGSNPNNFSYDVAFSTPYFYNGGNLLIEIRHFGASQPSRRVDSVSTATAGYGTLFSACWYPSNTTSFNNAFEDSFSVVNFKAVDLLTTNNFNKIETTIFPNPASENVMIESSSKISNVKLFNILGQLILVKELNQHSITLDLSQLSKGTYLILIENEFGIETKKVVKN
jgi:hypothetical protein